ncbi:288_t:CDS:2 [Acaulospora colombiana]|uniref:288_t:CDS:1 n=1 Tax=Acaulospora colombiana TaxID=27376 RepID=A0ACA9NMQ0_9GLOM|nr:288_t:CDS:2 [Acaulospora colombiana]
MPQVSQPVVMSIELCTQVNGQQRPRFFVVPNIAGASSSTATRASSTSTSAGAIPSVEVPSGGVEVDMGNGLGTWNSLQPLDNGGTLQVRTSLGATTGTWNFRVGLSTGSPLHSVSDETTLFGDSSSTTAVLFSPPIPNTGVAFTEPTFPQYNLPDATPSIPSPPQDITAINNSLIIIPTNLLLTADSAQRSDLTSSACFLQTLSNTSFSGDPFFKISSTPVLRNQAEGWRTQFLLDGLGQSTNYTIYTLRTSQSESTLSQPTYIKTKSTAFPCTLVHSLPFCPSVSWTAPLPSLGDNPSTYGNNNFPPNLRDMILNSLGNFTASLKTFPCGRDLYSIVQTCASCERAYRNWVCSTLIPRCGEVDTSTSAVPIDPPPALVPRKVGTSNTTSTFARLDQTIFGTTDSTVTEYTELLPCLETCHSVDRACPPMLQWTCPRKGISADKSYGVGFIDREGDDVSGGGKEGAGTTGKSQDGFGNVWCNGIV